MFFLAGIAPVLLIVGSIVFPLIQRNLSKVDITDGYVLVRNFPGPTRRIPISDINRFDQLARPNPWSRVRQVKVVALLTKGRPVPVLALGDPEENGAVPSLNNQLADARRSVGGRSVCA
jgi:hypothetical protein